jgi:hypothetical protein
MHLLRCLEMNLMQHDQTFSNRWLSRAAHPLISRTLLRYLAMGCRDLWQIKPQFQLFVPLCLFWFLALYRFAVASVVGMWCTLSSRDG